MSPAANLTPAGVASLLGCGERTVRQAIAAGQLRATPLVGAAGRVTGYAVTEAAARRWDAVRKRTSGRPAG